MWILYLVCPVFFNVPVVASSRSFTIAQHRQQHKYMNYKELRLLSRQCAKSASKSGILFFWHSSCIDLPFRKFLVHSKKKKKKQLTGRSLFRIRFVAGKDRNKKVIEMVRAIVVLVAPDSKSKLWKDRSLKRVIQSWNTKCVDVARSPGSALRVFTSSDWRIS